MPEYKTLEYWLHLIPIAFVIFVGLAILDTLNVVVFSIPVTENWIIAFGVLYLLVAIVDLIMHEGFDVE